MPWMVVQCRAVRAAVTGERPLCILHICAQRVEHGSGLCKRHCETEHGYSDGDGDAFGDALEATIGTEQFAACGENAWPPDINNDGVVSSADVFSVFPAWLKQLGDEGFSQRLDLNADGAISSSDVFTMFPHWLQVCP